MLDVISVEDTLQVVYLAETPDTLYIYSPSQHETQTSTSRLAEKTTVNNTPCCCAISYKSHLSPCLKQKSYICVKMMSRISQNYNLQFCRCPCTRPISSSIHGLSKKYFQKPFGPVSLTLCPTAVRLVHLQIFDCGFDKQSLEIRSLSCYIYNLLYIYIHMQVSSWAQWRVYKKRSKRMCHGYSAFDISAQLSISVST